jgi:PIN domain nuclease of toxin-antitoxin system
LILLDTHVVVWLAGDEMRLSKNARAAIEKARRAERGMAISDFTLYELSTLFRKKEIGLAGSLESFLSEVERRFVVLPITGRVCASAYSLPAGYPKDPGDRIIAATALVEGLTLVTADAQIRKSRAIPTIW